MKNLFKAALFAITLTSLISCSKNEAEGSDTESENLIQAVRVETLAKSDMRKFIEINGNIRTKEVILTFSSPDSRINAGIFAGVNLYLKDYRDVLSVPTSCIIEKAGKKFVYVIEENGLPAVQSDSCKAVQKVCFTEIKTGEEIVDRTIIEFAEAVTAQAGAVKVVTQGFETLQDGSEVNITE